MQRVGKNICFSSILIFKRSDFTDSILMRLSSSYYFLFFKETPKDTNFIIQAIKKNNER